MPHLNVAYRVVLEDGRCEIAHRRAFDGAWTLGYSDAPRGACKVSLVNGLAGGR